MWAFFGRDASKDFAYDVGEPAVSFTGSFNQRHTFWKVHGGKKKGSGDKVTIFLNDSPDAYESALSYVKKLKTLRHPSILMFLDSVELQSKSLVYLAVEYVEPIFYHLDHTLKEDNEKKQIYISWGLFQITRALSFLINDADLRHNHVNHTSIFVNSCGEWKLGGLEYMEKISDSTCIPNKRYSRYEDQNTYQIPETSMSQITKCSTDMYGLGVLIWEVFNGPLQQSSPRASLTNTDNIPDNLRRLYQELISERASQRPNPADFIMKSRKPGGYFKNELIDALLFLEEIQMKDKIDKSKFFNSLAPAIDKFPKLISCHKILPQLINAFEYGEAGASVLNPLFKIGQMLEHEEYQAKIVPCVVKLFGSNDRATRSRLLLQLEHFIAHVPDSIVNEQIFQQVVLGFLDTNPTIREQTVKSIIHLAPKLNYNNLNVETLRHFARIQAKDDQGGIRTNTTVCVGKIAHHLHPQIRQKVLISAFSRAMRDPFPPARNAGVLALAATQQYFLLSEVAQRILPALCQLSTDSEKTVRDSAFKTIKGFLGKLEQVSDNPSLRETMEADVHSTATPSLSNAAATWADWAVTAVTSKFYRSQSETLKSSRPTGSRPGARFLSKPASLEASSASSMSTTTTASSVASLASSLEPEGEGGGGGGGGGVSKGESMSDYDETPWDSETWGDMESSSNDTTRVGVLDPSSSLTTGKPSSSDGGDGWDLDDWRTLDEASPHGMPPPLQPTPSQWSMSNSLSALSLQENGLNSPSSDVNSTGGWEDTEWSPIEETEPSIKMEETRKRREEKKMQRQKELEAKRAAKTSSGPLKLGAKKL
uniref:N-terminal kinase-like protein n=3 Tax=Cacopsylla melanoneura TaxID=428564 RepID=A0A8D8YBN3_9HEMI